MDIVKGLSQTLNLTTQSFGGIVRIFDVANKPVETAVGLPSEVSYADKACNDLDRFSHCATDWRNIEWCQLTLGGVMSQKSAIAELW